MSSRQFEDSVHFRVHQGQPPSQSEVGIDLRLDEVGNLVLYEIRPSLPPDLEPVPPGNNACRALATGSDAYIRKPADQFVSLNLLDSIKKQAQWPILPGPAERDEKRRLEIVFMASSMAASELERNVASPGPATSTTAVSEKRSGLGLISASRSQSKDASRRRH